MNLLKIYQIGEQLMKTIPVLGRLHNSLSESIVNWHKRHNIVRFDNLRDPDSTDEDIKRSCAFFFSLATFLSILAIYAIFNLHISGLLFFLFLAFIPYSIGAINMEALKIRPKVTPQPVQNKVGVKTQLEGEKKTKRPMAIRLLRLIDIFIFGWLLYVVLWNPDKIQQWVNDYNLYYYAEQLNIPETNIGGIFAFGLFLAYIIVTRIIGTLLAIIKLLKTRTVKNYSKESMKRFH